jgi:hypothetical protein
MLAVIRQKMKMISRDAERARKTGRPNVGEHTGDVGEIEFNLGFGDIYQTISGFGRADHAGSHMSELRRDEWRRIYFLTTGTNRNSVRDRSVL